ncbi:MAG: VWA domain-containing protein [Acetobacteraceae bacterium]|nr:VWA domain-containing protein [Acetobacteraceae bacterium]
MQPGDALLAAWVIGILAVAGPAWQREPPLFAGDSPPVMIVLRVSASMQQADLQPTRLRRAQQKIVDLLASEPAQAAGLIAYDGSAHLVLPPTQDHGVVVTMAQALSPDLMPRHGDALGDAVALARRVLAEASLGGSVLVLTDDAAPFAQPPPTGAPVTILPVLPPGREPRAGLQAAASALDARVVPLTVDGSDVAGIGGRLASAGSMTQPPGEAERWRDGGWYLVPLLALVVLFWFRRGWAVLG